MRTDPIPIERVRYRFPVKTRYQIVLMRWSHPRSWRERWHDLVYLVRG